MLNEKKLNIILILSSVVVLLICVLFFLSNVYTFANATNDGFNNFGSAYYVPSDHPALLKLFNASSELCNGHQVCEHYQNIVRSSYQFNYMTTMLGSYFLHSADLSNFVKTSMTYMTRTAVLSFSFAFLIFLFLLKTLDRYSRTVVISVMGFSTFFYIFSPTIVGISVPLLGYTRHIYLLFFIILCLYLLHRYKNELYSKLIAISSKYTEQLDFTSVKFIIGMLIILALFMFARLTLADNKVLHYVMIIILSGVIFYFTYYTKKSFIIAFSLTSLLLFASLGYFNFWLMLYPAPRAQITLIAIVFIPILLLKPNSNYALLLPLLMLFHSSVATLVYFSILISELLTALVLRQKLTKTFWLSFLSLIISYFLTSYGVSGWGSLDSSSLSTLLVVILENSNYWLPNITIAGIMLISAGFILHKAANDNVSLLIRSLYLISVVIGLASLKHPLIEAGYNNLFPNVGPILLLGDYAAFPISTGVTIALLIYMVKAKETAGDTLDYRNLPILTTIFIVGCFMSVTYALYGPPQPVNLGKAIKTVEMAIDPEYIDNMSGNVSVLNYNDEIYYLQRENPINNALIYASLLKLKVRYYNNDLNVDNMQIKILD